ncbi:Ferric siderophore transport system, periplasmic binding protein TonB [Sandaracinus amylolyticus]|uniref:Ferric siderophore transport system, periplasmic binding protein TonB n=1 Tax=Sandaracinus amylolyticus TaxID=927083 RepID=A0A0F6YM43_9BACT|nr:Ferric siderophore transport system, periplasmic binding protein TonB [Sandaracinus amylolyticus]
MSAAPQTPRPVRPRRAPDELVAPSETPAEPQPAEPEPVVDAPVETLASTEEIGPAEGGAAGGVPGGTPGGVAGGVVGGVHGGQLGGVVGGAGTGPVTPVFMPSDMTPPRLVSGEQPGHTPQALSARVEGTMILRIAIRPDGTVGEVQVVRGLALLTEHVVATVSRWRFSPPVYQGRPISIYLTQRLRFEITGR